MNVSDFPILMIGDDAEEVAHLRQAFARANLVNPLRTAPGGAEGIAYLSGKDPYRNRKEYPLPSLLLVDLDHAEGWLDLLRWIRRQPAMNGVSIAIVATTLSTLDRERASRLGAQTWVRKPVDTEGLLRMMIATGMYWVILRKNQEDAVPVPAATAASNSPDSAESPKAVPAAVSGRHDTEILGDQMRFKKTSWDLVKSAEHSRGMDILIRTYWKPLYFFVRQKGFDNETAKDIVQDFLADALERGTIARADPARGKFRTFLLSALCNFIRDWHKSSNRLKRGGGQVTLSLDFDVGERQYSVEIASGETPETILNRAWLQSILEECISELTGNPVHLQAFRLMIQGSSYSSIARETGLSESAVKAAVFRLRQQLRDILLRRLQGAGDPAEREEFRIEDLGHLLK